MDRIYVYEHVQMPNDEDLYHFEGTLYTKGKYIIMNRYADSFCSAYYRTLKIPKVHLQAILDYLDKKGPVGFDAFVHGLDGVIVLDARRAKYS